MQQGTTEEQSLICHHTCPSSPAFLLTWCTQQVLWAECLCPSLSPPKSCAEARTPSVMVGPSGGNFRLRFGHECGPHEGISVLVRRGREQNFLSFSPP